MNLRQLGEDRLIERLVSDLPTGLDVIAGAGEDDCAVVRMPRKDMLLLFKTDCVVEGVHFLPKASALAVGWKAMMRPLSDFAAMSGLPQFALITLVVPPTKKVSWTTNLYRGLHQAASEFDVSIVGGETSATNGPAMISVSVAGVVEENRWIGRSGGQVGDELFVTGRLGGSRRSRHLRFRPRIEESRWLSEHFQIHAMMDLSDGLGADLPRLARASHLSFEIDENSVPRTRGCTIQQAINDGEDYELLFSISPEKSKSLTSKWRRKFPTLSLTRIGRFIQQSAISNQHWKGYVHFQ
jgi:thiamine-monophosphate kinase